MISCLGWIQAAAGDATPAISRLYNAEYCFAAAFHEKSFSIPVRIIACQASWLR
jgi:hypothetical protein